MAKTARKLEWQTEWSWATKEVNVDLIIWINTHQKLIKLTKKFEFYPGTIAMIFVIDRNDTKQFMTAKEELRGLFNEIELQYAIVLAFANKQDLSNSYSADKLGEILQLHSLKR